MPMTNAVGIRRLLCLLLVMVLGGTSVALGSRVSFRYWGDESYVKALEALAADFEREHSGVSIELQRSASGLPDSLIVAVAGGISPDASMAHGRYWVPLIESIQPLDDLIRTSSHLRRDNFIEALWENNIMLGRQMGLPLRANSRVLFYDIDAFEAKGISDPPSTWDELGKTAARLSERSGGVVTKWGLGLTSTSDYQGPVNMFGHRNGWRTYNDDFTAHYFMDEGITDAIEFLNDLVVRQIAANPLMPGVGSRVGDLAGGQAAIAIWGPYNVPEMYATNPSLHLGSFAVPRGPSGKPPYAIIAGESVIMMRAARDEAATLAWLEYLVFHRNEDYCRTSGYYFPVVRRALRQQEWRTELWGAVLDQYLGASFTGIPVVVDTSAVSSCWDAALKAVFLQQKGTKQAQAEVNELATTALKGFQAELAKLAAKFLASK